jgi:hypothetical protein
MAKVIKNGEYDDENINWVYVPRIDYKIS